MANKKISELTTLAGASLDVTADYIEVADMSSGESKKMTPQAFIGLGVDGFQAANSDVQLQDSFNRYAASTVFSHLAQSTEIGAYPWRCKTTTGGTGANNPSIVTDSILGRSLKGGTELYYLGFDMGTGVPIRNMTMTIGNKLTGTTAGNKNGLTIAFAPLQMIPSATSIAIQVGQIHTTIYSGNFAFSICTQTNPSLVFEPIAPDGQASTTCLIYPRDSNAVIGANAWQTMTWKFVGNICYITIAGTTWTFRDSRISAAAMNSFFFESAGETLGATNYDDYWLIGAISVNDDLNSVPFGASERSDLPGIMGKTGTLSLPPYQRLFVSGDGAGFAYGTPANSNGFACAQRLLSEKGFQLKLGASDGEVSTIYAGTPTTLDATSTTSQTLSTSWVNPGTPPLATLGDWYRQTVFLNFPNSNNKEVAVYITGSSQFTTGTINDTGEAKLVIWRRHSGSGKSNQLHFEYISSSRVVTGFAALDGNNGPQIRGLAATANGDIKIRYITAELYLFR